MVLYVRTGGEVNPKYYTEGALIQIFSMLKNWKIETINKEVFSMGNNGMFHVEAPEFSEDSFTVKSTKVKRDYAHPVDAGIVKFLDNKAVNAVFKNLVEMLADSTYGPIIASGIRISNKTYPEIDTIVDDCVKELGIVKPYVIISSSIHGLNAMAFGSDDEPYVAISPLLAQTMSPEQIRFIIGHECGHIAMGHMVYHTVISIATNFASAIPVIGPIVQKVGTLPLMAWSRRSEITADRAGLLCCGNVNTAKRTLLQLEMPFMKAEKIDISEYVSNSEEYLNNGVLRRLNEFSNAHPIIPKRIQALDEFVRSNKYYHSIGKNAPADTIDDTALESSIENIIKVI